MKMFVYITIATLALATFSSAQNSTANVTTTNSTTTTTTTTSNSSGSTNNTSSASTTSNLRGSTMNTTLARPFVLYAASDDGAIYSYDLRNNNATTLISNISSPKGIFLLLNLIGLIIDGTTMIIPHTSYLANSNGTLAPSSTLVSYGFNRADADALSVSGVNYLGSSSFVCSQIKDAALVNNRPDYLYAINCADGIYTYSNKVNGVPVLYSGSRTNVGSPAGGVYFGSSKMLYWVSSLNGSYSLVRGYINTPSVDYVPEILATIPSTAHYLDIGNNNVYITTDGGVYNYDIAAGAIKSLFTSLAQPRGIKFFNNMLYVADNATSSIYEYDLTSGNLTNLGISVNGPNGIFIDNSASFVVIGFLSIISSLVILFL